MKYIIEQAKLKAIAELASVNKKKLMYDPDHDLEPYSVSQYQAFLKNELVLLEDVEHLGEGEVFNIQVMIESLQLLMDSEKEFEGCEKSLSVVVIASPNVPIEALSEEDKCVQRETIVYVNSHTKESQIADAALDIYHDAIPVDCLDDFTFSVYLNGKQLTVDPNHESYSLKGEGHL